MKYPHSLKSLTVFIGILATTIATDLSVGSVILTDCGQTVQANNGRIEYKFNEFYDSNELCTFTIRAETVGNWLLTLESSGINQTSDPFAINILTFGENGLVEAAHLGPPNPLTQTYISGSIAVIIFKTSDGKNSNRGNGFKLSFSAVITNEYYGITGQDITFTNATDNGGTEVTIPFWDNPGRNRANVIVLSNGGKAVTDVFSSMKLTFLRESLQKHISVADCGYDAINIYTFTSEQIRHEETFCSLLHHRAVYGTKGIIILVFKDFEESYWNSHEATFRWEITTSD